MAETPASAATSVAHGAAGHVAPVIAAGATVLLLTLAGWTALLFEAARVGDGPDALWRALCTATGLTGEGGGFSSIAAAAGLWTAMTAAMMLPTASAAALGYAERMSGTTRGVLAPFILIAGYLSFWTAIALGLAGVQAGLERILDLFVLPQRAAGVIAGAAVGAAGLYQFTPLKERCLASCRLPLGGAVPRGDPAEAFRLGFRYGMNCVGCCGPMMGMMVLAGTMNLVWTAVFAALMTVERFSGGLSVARAIGAVLIASGIVLGVSAVGPGAIAAHFLR